MPGSTVNRLQIQLWSPNLSLLILLLMAACAALISNSDPAIQLSDPRPVHFIHTASSKHLLSSLYGAVLHHWRREAGRTGPAFSESRGSSETGEAMTDGTAYGPWELKPSDAPEHEFAKGGERAPNGSLC